VLGNFLEYIIVPFINFGEETQNGQAQVEPDDRPQRYPTESIHTARQFRLKRIE